MGLVTIVLFNVGFLAPMQLVLSSNKQRSESVALLFELTSMIATMDLIAVEAHVKQTLFGKYFNLTLW